MRRQCRVFQQTRWRCLPGFQLAPLPVSAQSSVVCLVSTRFIATGQAGRAVRFRDRRQNRLASLIQCLLLFRSRLRLCRIAVFRNREHFVASGYVI